jgi:hypothetical protein
MKISHKANGLVDSPDFASLVTLSAQAQRGIFFIYIFFFPLYTEGEERAASEAKSGEY